MREIASVSGGFKGGHRFLKHLAGVIPGDMEKIISVGISAGGAMSSLLGVTGDSPLYQKELEDMGGCPVGDGS